MNFYKHFIGDYQRDTGDLSLIEHGALRLMLDHFYGTGRPLPKDKKALCRLLRAETDAERKAIAAVSLRFWRQLPPEIEALYDWLELHTDTERLPLQQVVQDWTEVGGLVNVRALAEIVKASVIAAKNRKTAIEREANRRAAVEEKRGQAC
jgi:hypothetical protein